MKSAISHLVDGLDLGELKFCRREKLYYWSNEKYVTEIKLGETVIGIINQLNTGVAKKIGIKRETVIAELYIAELLKIDVSILFKTSDVNCLYRLELPM